MASASAVRSNTMILSLAMTVSDWLIKTSETDLRMMTTPREGLLSNLNRSEGYSPTDASNIVWQSVNGQPS